MTNLIKTRRFGPFFWTQFFGAFNDNVFKNGLVMLIAFNAVTESESAGFANLAAGLFILPFFLLSPLAGQLADKYDKAQLIRKVKFVEILIMILGAIGLYGEWPYFLLGVLFLMGSQSTFFGPAKYSILPQHLSDHEIMSGTSLVEMGTFLAILLGTVIGGVMAELAPEWIGATVIVLAIIGYLTSRWIPKAPASDPQLKLNFNPFSEYRELIRISKKRESVYQSLLGISWFWFLGAVVLAQLPSFVKHSLQGDKFIATCLLATFTLSIAIGSILCDKISDKNIELGIVPFGAVGLSVFMIHLGLMDYDYFLNTPLTVAHLKAHWNDGPTFWVFLDLFMIGLSSSLFIVPLYALLQHRSDKSECSRVIAANNILNSLFMVASAAFAIVLVNLGVSTHEIMAVVGLMNIAVSVYMFTLLPEFILRLGIWVLAKTVYTLRYTGRHHIPSHGACVLIANHISFIDWLVITAASQRPVRFVMDHRIFKMPLLHWIFKVTKAIPIAPAKEDPDAKERAFATISEALREGHAICIFPEGMISHDGNFNAFRPGIETILQRDQVPVIPMALTGLWGSFFSRKNGKAMRKVPKPRRRRIIVNIGAPLTDPLKAKDYQTIVEDLYAHAQTT